MALRYAFVFVLVAQNAFGSLDCDESDTCWIEPGAGCLAESDCALGQICEDHQCVVYSPLECDSDQDCGDQFCVEGCCESDRQAICASDNECGEGYCVEGRCQAEPGQCASDADCGSDHFCFDGLCKISPPIQCHFDSQCQPEELCLNGFCESQELSTCSEIDCDPGQTCELVEIDCYFPPCPKIPACVGAR